MIKPEKINQKIFIAYRYNDTDAGQVLANIGVAHQVAYESIKAGWIPFIPHTDCLLAIMFGKKLPLKFYYDYSIEWLKSCDAICIVDDGRPLSSGVKRELGIAEALGIKVIWEKIELSEE